MNLAEKIVIAKQAINSISRHDDEDAAVRLAMLARVQQHIDNEREDIEARNRLRIAELTGAASQ